MLSFNNSFYVSLFINGEKCGDGVKILSTVNGNIVAAQQNRQLVTAFHPELNEDLRVHEYFLKIISHR